MIVADTNLVIYLLVESEKSEIARTVWQKDSTWMLPTLWRSEFLNVLITNVRARLITLDGARQTWRFAKALFDQSEVETSGDEVLEIAAERNLTAYDAQFVVAASNLHVPLVTSDRKLLQACPDLAISPEQFA